MENSHLVVTSNMIVLYRFCTERDTVLLIWFQLILKLIKCAEQLEVEFL